MYNEDLENFIKNERELCIDSPLFMAVSDYAKKTAYRFHTPGHGGEGLFPLDYSLDVTEVQGLDSLFEASGAILKAEEAAAKLFGAKRTLISAGGCTLCIQTMLALALKNGDKAIFGRNCHRSAVNAAALLNIDPVFVLPRQGRITPEDLRLVLSQNTDAKSVYITSPDYYGRISDITALSKVCGEYDVPLLVDNAHGSHLILSKRPLHPIKLGAAMTACSAHKTLPVLTGGAWLNIADEKYVEEAKSKMSLFGSSSPSYLTMISLDLARTWCEKYGFAAFENLCECVSAFKEFAVKKGFVFENGEADPVRITLNAASVGYKGEELADLFRSFGIEPEYVDLYSVVLLPSLLCGDDAFSALKSAANKLEKRKQVTVKESSFLFGEACERVMTVRDALLFRKHKTVDCREAVGKISAQVLCPCPPGIPVCLPGELIKSEHISVLLDGGIEKITIIQ